MRSYYFGRLLAGKLPATVDHEVVFLSAVLHDIGLTTHARGTRRFEIEGADAARSFVRSRGLADDKAWLIWDNIALHTLDLNLHKEREAQSSRRGFSPT